MIAVKIWIMETLNFKFKIILDITKIDVSIIQIFTAII